MSRSIKDSSRYKSSSTSRHSYHHHHSASSSYRSNPYYSEWDQQQHRNYPSNNNSNNINSNSHYPPSSTSSRSNSSSSYNNNQNNNNHHHYHYSSPPNGYGSSSYNTAKYQQHYNSSSPTPSSLILTSPSSSIPLYSSASTTPHTPNKKMRLELLQPGSVEYIETLNKLHPFSSTGIRFKLLPQYCQRLRDAELDLNADVLKSERELVKSMWELTKAEHIVGSATRQFEKLCTKEEFDKYERGENL
nr:5032_t:CDS:2 [Entrophospora candida]